MLRSIFITICILKIVNLYETHEQIPENIFYKDHEVSYEEAKENIKLFRENTFQHCNPCTKKHRDYCESEEFLNDHCKNYFKFIYFCKLIDYFCFQCLGCCNQGYTKGNKYLRVKFSK